jgi:DNA-binding NtrC family response regulator
MADAKDFRLLLVAIDDEPDFLDLITDALGSIDGLEIATATDALRGLQLVQQRRPQIVLTDLSMPQMSGMEMLERIVAFDPSIDVILITGHYTSDSAVEAIQKGACDYLTKPVPVARLQERIGKLVEQARARHRVVQLDDQLAGACRFFEGLVGRSPLMLELFAKVERVAPHFRTVLVTGPTGSGKELLARALHQKSPVADGPFISCNCSAVVETLFESELFGYMKGAFTGAAANKPGLFEAANQGTLFLDEIGEMPLAMQAKLLRVLQNHEVRRVGATSSIHVDVHVIAATNRDLRAQVAEREFREDLYYRLAMVELSVPSLRDRMEDLPLLQRAVLEKYVREYRKPVRGITRRAQALLARHRWPGNVRELENVIGNACMMAQSDLIDVGDLPAYLRTPQASADDPVLITLDEMTRRHAHRVLDALRGNKLRAAEVLGISRATLYRILQEEAAHEPAAAGLTTVSS